MARTILICSGKGGAGKSTVSACLARALCARGRRVLLADGDAGLRTLDLLTGLGENAVFTWADAAAGNCAPAEAVCLSPDGALGLLLPPARPDAPNPDAFSRALRAAAEPFDYCLLDAPAGLGGTFPALLAAAGEAVLVATPDRVCLRAAAVLAELLFDRLPAGSVRLLLNRYSRAAVRRGECLSPDEAVDACGVRLLGAVPQDARLTQLAAGTLPEEDTRAAFARVAARLEGEDVPFKGRM